MDFKAPCSIAETEDSCQEEPDCKFKVGGKGRSKQTAVPARPKAKKGKKAAPKAPRLVTDPSPVKGKDEAQTSPLKGFAKEEKEGSDGTCDEERIFLVRVRAGIAKAEVMFLNNRKGDGWEGPFDLKMPLQSLLEFDLLPLPKRARVRKERASSDAKKEDSGEDESKREEKTPPGRLGKAAAGALEKHLDGKRGAGFDDLMASSRSESEVKKALESEPTKPWKDLFPKFEVGELVVHYDRHGGEWRWWRAWVETIILPTETQYRDGMVDILYQICPHPIEKIGNARIIIKEYRLRTFRAEHLCYGGPQVLTSLPNHPSRTFTLHGGGGN